MELTALQSVINVGLLRLYGYRFPPPTLRFRMSCGFQPTSSPIPVTVWVYPLVSFASPSEYMLLVTDPAHPKVTGYLLQGFASSSRH
jgi:hypothetical protein